MIRPRLFTRRNQHGFTVIELLVSIAIVGLLAALVVPEWGRTRRRAESVTCTNNLRQIGIGVLAYVAEHDNTYPIIEPNPGDPVYTDDSENPDNTEQEAKPLFAVLEPYGVNQEVLRCPTDVRGSNYYASRAFAQDGKTYHSSYQWRVMLDGENAASPKIYGGRRGWSVRNIKASRATICTDFEAIHSGRMNRLYADGHVSKPH